MIKEAKSLGLLRGKVAATMATAKKLTAQLAEVFPDDPVRGDFALFGHGRANAEK